MSANLPPIFFVIMQSQFAFSLWSRRKRDNLPVAFRQRSGVPILLRRALIDNLEIVIFDDLWTVAHLKRDLALVLRLLHAVAAE